MKEPCCSFGPPPTEPGGALAPGKYRVRLAAPTTWSGAAAPSGEIEIEVTK